MKSAIYGWLVPSESIPDRLSVGMIVPYWPSQISASDSVNMRPQKRFVDWPTPSEKSIATVDVKNKEISKHIIIRTIVELKCEAICSVGENGEKINFIL